MIDKEMIDGYVIVVDFGVVDRFDTEKEAYDALVEGGYPENAYVDYDIKQEYLD